LTTASFHISFCSVVKEGEEALAVCRKLVERMPNLECRNTQQRTPLHVAALAGNQGTSSSSSTVDYSPLTDCPNSGRKLFILLNFSKKTLLCKQNLKMRNSGKNVFRLRNGYAILHLSSSCLLISSSLTTGTQVIANISLVMPSYCLGSVFPTKVRTTSHS
jgi:hypothetical protein